MKINQHARKFILLIALSVIVKMQAFAEIDPSIKALFQPLPEVVESPTNKVTQEKVALGKKLFFETKLSKDNSISCNSCHNLNTYGVDNQATSKGHLGQLGKRNSPTVLNSAMHAMQFWDGRAKDVEEQALGPILNPVEMAMASDSEVIDKLKIDKEYLEMFRKAFPGEANPVTFKNIGLAIGAFERKLQTPSRFDSYLKGDENALSELEKKGLMTFKDTGCIACHSGSAVGGQMFQKLGLVKPYPTEDLGRYEVTKNESDKYMFKVPSLRNIEKTSPYFHDGKVKTLEEAIALMAEHQLGRKLEPVKINEIAAFLKSLTGEVKIP